MVMLTPISKPYTLKSIIVITVDYCGTVDHNMRKDGKFVCCIASVETDIESTKKRTYTNRNSRVKDPVVKDSH